MAEPGTPQLVVLDTTPSRQRAASAGHRVLSRRIRRSSGTFNPGALSPDNTETDPSALYCVCRQPYNKKRNMVQCDRCEDWFHPECVGIRDLAQLPPNVPYYCPNCEAPPASRPRSASSAPAYEVPEGGRPRSYSNSRKRPKVPSSAASGPSTPGPSPLALEDLTPPSSLPRSSARPIKREPRETSESMSLPNYLHTPYSLRARHCPTDTDSSFADESGSSGRPSRSRHRYVDELEDVEGSEHDFRYASPTDGIRSSSASRRRRGQQSVLPGLESLSIHSGDFNGGYQVHLCPNRLNPFHTCTSYCAVRWGGPNKIVEEPVSRSPIFHDDADHKRVFHNERERVRRSTIRNMFEALRRSVPAVEGADSTSDRHILEEAAQHIRRLNDEGRDLERGVMQLRIENLQLRLAQVPPESPAAAALSAQLAAAMCAAEAVDCNGQGFPAAILEGIGLPYGPAVRPDDPGPDGASPESSSSTSSVPMNDARDDLETLLLIAEEEYAKA